ncbi:MAG: HD domain-containing protein [Oscillospiraceae bacterium]|nr:HD domain-containing protein [Oscillospiraceae bacterium]
MEHFTTIRSLIGALAISMNLINPDMQHHHEQTAYLAFQIGYEMGLRGDDLNNTVYAALLHDVGSVVSPEPESLQVIEAHRHEIAAIGAAMLQDLEHFETVAGIIALNQNSYQENLRLLDGLQCEEVCMDISQAIHLADVVTSLIKPGVPILNQAKHICAAIEQGRNTEFSPKALDAFQRCAGRECLWMDAALNPAFLLFFTGDIRTVSLDETVKLTKLMSRIIDYRSSFTAMHSAGVAASATALAKLVGMSEDECKMMTIAGYLHDVGKLRVPNTILEKPGKLTEEEFNIVKEHTYYTRMILMGIDGFEKIADWAAFHHEKLNGKGYPFHLGADELDTGSRIMAVADIFSAITEVRPYRDGMRRDAALRVMWDNVASGALDGALVRLLEDNYDAVDAARERTSREAGARYFRSLEERRT